MRERKKSSSWLLALVALVLVTASTWVLMAQVSRPVDDITLRDAGTSGEEWLTYNINWAEHRYSPLTQINAANVSRLGLAWSVNIPAATGNPQNRQEGTPLVHNGILYSIAPWSVVYAIDARSGKELWRNDPEVNQQVWSSRICCGVVNRGIALYEGKVIAPVVDGRLRALEAATGKIVWEVRVSPENMPYTITQAPRVIKGGKVIIGVSGGEYGVRGFFSAYDAKTGEMAWRFYTVPGDPSKPFEHPDLKEAAKTWDASKEWWKIGGGGGVWGGIAYDPDVDLVYVTTGQPAPWTSVHRGEGDALYSNSILAVRGATGQLVWYFQTVPGDDWDYDSIADVMLADLPMNGKTRKVIMHAPKSGFFYVVDRLTGELLSADPFVAVSWAAGFNLQTGRAVVNPEARYGTTAVNVMPGPGGGHVWPPWSYNPTAGLVYIPATTGTGYSYNANPNYTAAPVDIGPTGRGQMNMGTGGGGGGRGAAAGGGRGAAPGAPAAAGAPGGGAAGRGAAPAAAAPGLDPPVVAGGGRGAAAPTAPAGRGGAAPAAPAAGRGGGGAPAAPPQPSRMLFLALDASASGLPAPAPATPPAGGAPAGGRGGAAPAGGGGGGQRGAAAPAVTLPVIGPQGGRGNYLIAWDPVAQKERWRGAVNSAAGFNQGGTLATAGNLVFSAGTNPNRLLAFRADTGELLLDLPTGLNQMGPPMTYMIDGKQYLVIAGGPGAAPGAGGAGRGGAAAPATPGLDPPVVAPPAPAGRGGAQ